MHAAFTFLPLRDTTIAPGDHTRTLNFGGLKRSYIIHIPAHVMGLGKLPVVLVFHGGGSNAIDWEKFCGFNETAEKNNFIVVYPNGTGRIKGYEDKVLGWNGGPHEPGGDHPDLQKIDDVGFTRALLDDLSAVLPVDKKRVYATGMSMGAIMVYRLGSELSDRIAAIATIAGSMGTDSCRPIRAVPVMDFHGTADPGVPFEGGKGKIDPSGAIYYSAEFSVQSWVKADGCNKIPTIDTLPAVVNDSTVVVRKKYTAGKNGAEIIQYVIIGGGHTWPGIPPGPGMEILGRTTKSIQANDLIWEFFKKHPMQ